MDLTLNSLTKPLAGFALSLLCVGARADGLPPLNKLHHLEPLDKPGIELYQSFTEFIKNVAPISDRRVSAIYAGIGSKSGDFIGIYQTKDAKGYYLLYAALPERTETTMALPAAFADEVDGKLENTIIVGTRYSTEAVPLVGCLGAKYYLFESQDDLYGTVIDCVAVDSALHLVHIADSLTDLVKLKSSSEEEQNKKMAEILSELNAANQEATRTDP